MDRGDFYEKELTFQVSCSYGPGRYDDAYEAKGQDYPVAFVRWTEKRNFEAVLDLMASGLLNVSKLITHRFAFENAPDAYDLMIKEKNVLGILLEYSHDVELRHVKSVELGPAMSREAMKEPHVSIGFIGAGNYASRMLIPAFRKAGAHMQAIASLGAVSSVIQGSKHRFSEANSDAQALLTKSDINTMVIATRHDSHAKYVIEAIEAGKHVFVEKPLGLTLAEIDSVAEAYKRSTVQLMVGFNRRFAPQAQTMKRLLQTVVGPKTFMSVMNVGSLPSEHWTQDHEAGGGRIIGEACHHIDLIRFLVGEPIVSVQARRVGDTASEQITEDKAVIILGFADGSFGTVHYLANGPSSFPKERIEVFCQGRVLQLDNFIKLKGYNWPSFSKQNLWRQDKGQSQCAAAFVEALKSGTEAPIQCEELFEVARVSIEVATLLRNQSN